MTDIDELEEAYCEAAHALWEWRRAHGFEPGARVEYRFRDTHGFGVIAPYGDAWAGVDSMHVPILRDCGGLQPWMLSHLTLDARVTA